LTLTYQVDDVSPIAEVKESAEFFDQTQSALGEDHSGDNLCANKSRNNKSNTLMCNFLEALNGPYTEQKVANLPD